MTPLSFHLVLDIDERFPNTGSLSKYIYTFIEILFRRKQFFIHLKLRIVCKTFKINLLRLI